MKKVSQMSSLRNEDVKTALPNKNYKRITINNKNVPEREEKTNTTIKKVAPLNYFAGPHFLFSPQTIM